MFVQHRKPFLRKFSARDGKNPPDTTQFPRRFEMLSGLGDLCHARIGAQGELTQKFAVQVKLLFELFGERRTLRVGGHDVGNHHD